MRREPNPRRGASAGPGSELPPLPSAQRSSCSLRLPAPRSSAGFSMIELLVTVLIILVLTTLYWSPRRSSHQRALLNSCQRNLQLIYTSMAVFANEHSGRFPSVPGAKSSGEALEGLVPKYTSDTSVFVCPASKDSTFLPGESLQKHPISYAYYMGRGITNSTSALLSDKQVDTKPKVAGQLIFSETGKPPGNNHRKYGGNILFGDGHVELSPPHVPFALPLDPGEILLNP